MVVQILADIFPSSSTMRLDDFNQELLFDHILPSNKLTAWPTCLHDYLIECLWHSYQFDNYFTLFAGHSFAKHEEKGHCNKYWEDLRL
jgi:hypothetical protein